MYSQFGLFIDGGWSPGTQTAEVISPLTEKPLGAVPMATADDTRAALDAAARALPRLRGMGGFARADALHRAADEMIRRSDEAAAMITAETGKPIAQAGREWVLACEQFRWFAEEARRIYGRVIDSRVRKVSLTGSTRIGQQMIRDAAETVKKVSMELGGNAPLIIHDDADLDAALDLTVPAKFANAGQVCVTPDRIFVHDSLHNAFVQGFVARTAQIRLGDGLDPDTGMGPLINGARLSEIESIVADAVRGGATLAHGGQRPAHLNSGFFFEPTVLTGVTDDMKVFAGENFGPIAAITRFATEDEVTHRANASDMGLSAYAFTRSPDRARRMVAALKAGMVGINSFALAASEAPFGGTNHSGMGREGGIEGIEDYLDIKLAQIVF